MNFRVLPEASHENIAAMLWYDAQRPELGDRFQAAVATAFQTICDHPTRFARVPRYHGKLELKQIVLDGFPYLVIYSVREDEVLVVTIAHSKRRPLYWLRRLKDI